MQDILSTQIIKRFLPEGLQNLPISLKETVGSTNDVLKAAAKAGAPHGSVLIALRQTAGKGRLGRSFLSPSDTGIYMSILLRPDLSAAQSVLITTAAAVAVNKALAAAGAQNPAIKWVNDIYVGGKKVCGILTESVLNGQGRLDYAVLGIGINVYPPKEGFGELESKAGAAFASPKENLRNRVIAAILTELHALFTRLPEKPHLAYYREHCLLLGKEITVLRAGGEQIARALAIDEDFHLIADTGGEKFSLSSGEVSVRLIH